MSATYRCEVCGHGHYRRPCPECDCPLGAAPTPEPTGKHECRHGIPHGTDCSACDLDPVGPELRRARLAPVSQGAEQPSEGEKEAWQRKETFGTAWICAEVRRALNLPDGSSCARYLEAIETLRSAPAAPRGDEALTEDVDATDAILERGLLSIGVCNEDGEVAVWTVGNPEPLGVGDNIGDALVAAGLFRTRLAPSGDEVEALAKEYGAAMYRHGQHPCDDSAEVSDKAFRDLLAALRTRLNMEGEPVAWDLKVMLDLPGWEVWTVEETVRSQEDADRWLRGASDVEHYRVVPLYASPPPEAGWRPWNTRPMDGREVLGLFGDRVESVWCLKNGDWHWMDGDYGQTPPTYWMPCPAPPEASERTPTEEGR